VHRKFPTYRINTNLLEPGFLAYFFKTARLAQQAQDLSKGAAAISKLTLNPPQFWELTIPLPPLPEQQRIVARIEALAQRVEEAQRLRLAANQESSFLTQKGIDSAVVNQQQFRCLSELLCEPLINGLSLPASQIGQEGIAFAKVGIVNSGRIDVAEIKRVNIVLPEDSHYWMRPDDVLVSRGNSLKLVGRAAVYEGQPEKLAFPDLLIRLRLDQTIADPHFVAAYFHSHAGRAYIEARASGTSPSMKKVSQPKLEAMPIPLPPLDQQRSIVASLAVLQSKADMLLKIQAQTHKELDALMPSILAKAFAGQL
jgi:type I restriction enzyme S subunit